MHFERHPTWFLCSFVSCIIVNGAFNAPARWQPCQCRLFFSWPAKITKTDIFEVLICFFDALREASIMVFVLIRFTYYCEWGFLRTCSLASLPVSTVFRLASRDYENGYFRGPELLLLMDFERHPT